MTSQILIALKNEIDQLNLFSEDCIYEVWVGGIRVYSNMTHDERLEFENIQEGACFDIPVCLPFEIFMMPFLNVPGEEFDHRAAFVAR